VSVRRLGVLALALASAGCATLPANRGQAQATAPAALEARQSLATAIVAPSAWPDRDWWRALGDEQLNSLIAEAIASSPGLRVAEARTREAIARAGVAEAARFPQVNVGADATRERFSANGIYPPPFAGHWGTLSDLSATLSWDIDLWGQLRHAQAAALDSARAQSVDAEAARLALSVEVAHTYVALGRAFEALDVAKATRAQRETIYGLTRDRNAAGIDSKLELKQAESALPPARAQVVAIEESIALGRDALAALLGQGPDRGLVIERPHAQELAELAIPSRLPADLIGRRPDIAAQRWRIESARHGVASAKAAFYPNVNLTALLGFENLGTANLVTAANREIGAGPALNLPVFDGGRRRAALAASDAGYDAAVEGYNQLIADALRQVVDRLASARSVAAQRIEQRQGLATAQDAYDLAVLRYKEGVGNYLQVLTTETQLLSERALEVDLRARSLDVAIDLINALGGGFDENPPAGPRNGP